jgi:polynucleotide 5'-kinase involved in rRNA processing
MQFQQDFNRKERKEHRDKGLWCFFFAIFVVNSSLVAACRAGTFAPFRGKSIEVPLHEQLALKSEFFSIKVNQTKSKHFFQPLAHHSTTPPSHSDEGQ